MHPRAATSRGGIHPRCFKSRSKEPRPDTNRFGKAILAVLASGTGIIVPDLQESACRRSRLCAPR